MKLILYVPETVSAWNSKIKLMDVRIGGISLLERAIKVFSKDNFEQCYVLVPENIVLPNCGQDEAHFTRISYTAGKPLPTLLPELLEKISDERICFCCLDGVISSGMFVWKGLTGEYRMSIDGEETCCWVVRKSTLQFEKADNVPEVLASRIKKLAESDAGAYYQQITSRADCKAGLLKVSKALRKPLGFDMDGIITYYINRPVSLWITRRLSNTRATPSAVTWTGMFLGVLGAILVAISGPVEGGFLTWLLMVVGALLWQISSILDGVDGELARMRLAPSHRGEWLDTICDDVTHFTFFLGLCVAMQFEYGSVLWVIVGGFAALIFALSVGMHYREFHRLGLASYKAYYRYRNGEQVEEVIDEHKVSFWWYIFKVVAKGIKWIVKRDFYTFIIFCLLLVHFDRFAYLFMLISITSKGIKGLIIMMIETIKRKWKEWKEKRAISKAKAAEEREKREILAEEKMIAKANSSAENARTKVEEPVKVESPAESVSAEASSVEPGLNASETTEEKNAEVKVNDEDSEGAEPSLVPSERENHQELEENSEKAEEPVPAQEQAPDTTTASTGEATENQSEDEVSKNAEPSAPAEPAVFLLEPESNRN